jgi:hypothetical protein
MIDLSRRGCTEPHEDTLGASHPAEKHAFFFNSQQFLCMYVYVCVCVRAYASVNAPGSGRFYKTGMNVMPLETTRFS